ncbi:putative ATP-dependent helicase [Pseudocercospora fuligena]|uniref:Putative ATP-dependent helicase n=1 Tax=Pseudocercospora fuligena TaxID=685502 RepID=A0A8H6RJS9_9PEZI|nr:putative ATP-dependent helicase [Pseudocercospora fuligena]
MVRERSPSRTSSGQFLSPQKKDRQPLANISAKMQSPNQKQAQSSDSDKAEKRQSGDVEFGRASPLRNPLKKSSPSIFMPKNRPHMQNRPVATQNRIPSDSYRASVQAGQAASSTATKPSSLSGRPDDARQFKSSSSLQQGATTISVPTNPPPRTIHPPQQPTYSSSTATMNPYATFVPPRQVIDLTRPQPKPQPHVIEDDDSDGENFDPDAEIRANSGKFGAIDPYMYMDSTRADEDMKKLLEAAFDDEAEKGKTRLRSRIKKVEKLQEEDTKTKSLASKLAALSVKQDEEAKKEEDEDEQEEDGTVDGLSVKLLPHQVEGVSWMIDKEIGRTKTRGILPKGGILADDMGLGKTVQSVALMLTNPRPAIDAKPEFKGQKLPGKDVGKGTLVVAPLALIKQWESEIKSKVNKSHAMKVLVHHGANRTKNSAELKKYDVVITTFQTLTSEHAGSNMNSEYGTRVGCFGVHWYRLMLDEAHSIKNRNAKSTLACCALNSWYRWCLTGTPMQNNLDELQSLIKFLRIKPYCELPRWKDQITQPMKAGRGGLAMNRLQVFLKAFMKRRTKDILKKDGALNFGGKSATTENGEAKNGGMQIVKREVLTVECQFDPVEKEYYDRLQARADKRLEQMMEAKGNADYIGALVLLLRLRQMCDHPQLIEMAMAKDKDAMTTGLPNGKRAGKDEGDEMDALTALMGGVSVETKNCDVCQIKLSAAESRDGAVRCSECEADLKAMKGKKSSKKQKKTKGENRKSKSSKTADESELEPHSRRARNRKVVLDSDDEDEEGGGEWLVGKHARNARKAPVDNSGDDEDEESGGETLDTIDSERSDEDDSQINDSPSRARKMKVVDSDDETEASGDEEKADEDSETDNSAEDDGAESDQSGLLEGMSGFSKPKHAPSTKIRQLLRILHTETPKHKTIVFSQFTTMLDLIEPHLRHADIRFVRYDGSMRPDAREQSLNSLRNDRKTRVLLCSLKCGSLGLNLTAASRVVIVEPFWNPFVEEQAIDRVHRLNQTVDVKVFRLTIRETVEERILELQEKKRELANAAIEGGAKGMGNLSMKDILGLFKHDAENIEHANDREYWAKLGDDNRLLDGPAHVSASDHVRDLSDIHRPMPKAQQSRRIEDPIYGRRW